MLEIKDLKVMFGDKKRSLKAKLKVQHRLIYMFMNEAVSSGRALN